MEDFAPMRCLNKLRSNISLQDQGSPKQDNGMKLTKWSERVIGSWRYKLLQVREIEPASKFYPFYLDSKISHVSAMWLWMRFLHLQALPLPAVNLIARKHQVRKIKPIIKVSTQWQSSLPLTEVCHYVSNKLHSEIITPTHFQNNNSSRSTTHFKWERANLK